MEGHWESFFGIWAYQPFKSPVYSHLTFIQILQYSLLTHTSISSPSIFSPHSSLNHLYPFSPLQPTPCPDPSWSAAAVTGGQEVKAKVECHTHRVTAMPRCCVSLWMESSECQTRWRAPDALTLAWACPFPSRGHRRGPVLAAPPVPPGHHHYCCNSCH